MLHCLKPFSNFVSNVTGKLMKSNKKNKPIGRHVTRFPGIVADARELGVNRIHLYLVLSGQRQSKSLLRRYANLQKFKNKEE